MGSSLLLQQWPAWLVRLIWIVFVMGGRWSCSSCFVGCCLWSIWLPAFLCYCRKTFSPYVLLSSMWCIHIAVSTQQSCSQSLWTHWEHSNRYWGGRPRGVMVKAMDCGIVVREFVLQSRYYIHFRASTLGKGMSPLILPAIAYLVRLLFF